MIDDKTIWLQIDESVSYDEVQIICDTIIDVVDCEVVVIPDVVESLNNADIREFLKELIEMYEVEL